MTVKRTISVEGIKDKNQKIYADNFDQAVQLVREDLKKLMAKTERQIGWFMPDIREEETANHYIVTMVVNPVIAIFSKSTVTYTIYKEA